MTAYHFLEENRALVRILGQDNTAFLQGLITNDINKINPENSIYSALLTPQGKFLHDFYVFEDKDQLLIDIDFKRQADFVNRLSTYKLRSKIDIVSDESPSKVSVVFGTGIFTIFNVKDTKGFTSRTENTILFVDPRLQEMGIRIYSGETFDPNKYGLKTANFMDFEQHRLKLGIPVQGTDMIIDKAIPLECGLDELNAIDWEKGCYMGQELTARTKYRGLVRKRLLPLTFDTDTIPPMTPIMLNEKEVGTMRSSCMGYGIGLIRLEALDALNAENPLTAGQSIVKPHLPKWIKV